MLSSVVMNYHRECHGQKAYSVALYKTMKIFLLSIMLLFASSQSKACSPVLTKEDRNPKLQIKKAFANEDLIAYVYVEKVERKNDEYNAHLRILESFKGQEQLIQTGWRPECCMCDYQFQEKTVHLIYARKYDEFWSIWAFGPSKELKWVTAKDLKYLHKYGGR